MSLNLKIINNLPFVTMKVEYRDKEKSLDNVLIDTGSVIDLDKGTIGKEI